MTESEPRDPGPRSSRLRRSLPWIALTCVVLIAAAAWYLHRNAGRPRVDARNVILIGWDGCLIDDVRRLMKEGRLPNASRLLAKGQMVDTFITSSLTETKPGWAEILTGYGPEVTLVYDNRAKYDAVPQGLTVFERLRASLGKDNIRTVFIAGKLQNLGIRGQHRVLLRGKRKTWHDETLWTDDEKKRTNEIIEHEHEPYFYTKDQVDVFKNGLGDAQFVGRAACDELDAMAGRRFFMFLHFWEPDESGHDYGEGEAQYLDAIVGDDEWLGKIMDKLEALGIADDTVIYLTTDHGFDRGRTSHRFAPHTFVITNEPRPLAARGDRKDITPTILTHFGIDVSKLTPPLEGRSMLK